MYMIDHASLSVSDFEKSKALYTAALKPIGYEMLHDMAEWSVCGFGEGGKADFWIAKKDAVAAGHIAFAATSKESVDAFHAAGLQAGATDNGKPGYRKEYAPGYYAAFLLDSDGNNVEVVFHDPHPSE